MIVEIKVWEIRCDFCPSKHTETSAYKPSAPEGWGYVKVGPCGLTDYYRDELACPECLAKRKDENEN